jgi:ribosomal protein L21E
MDRHHLLGLLDKLQSKYDFMDSEYKEFAEAIGGKKKMIEVKVGDMVKIKYEKIETVVDTSDDEFFTTIHVMNKCCGIWKVVDNENRWHGHDWLSYTYLHKSYIHIDAMKRVIKEYTEGNFIKTTIESDSHRRYCLLVTDIEIIS